MAAPAISNYAVTAAFHGNPGTNPQTYDVTLPTYSAGDFVIIHLLINAGDLGQPPTPTGWTIQGGGWTYSGTGTSVQTGTFTRVMDGSEGTTVHYSKSTFNAYNWKAVASSWANVDSTTPVATSSSNTSGAGVHTLTWTIGTITGAFESGREAYWGGQYLKLNSDDGMSYSEIGTLTVQLGGLPDYDITTAYAADYDVLDTSEILVGVNHFRHVLVRHATLITPGSRIWKRF